MSARATLRALPTLMRVGVAEAIAYRAEMLVWLLATTMPFVMLVMWTAVAQNAPVVSASGKLYGSATFTAYFFAVFIARQLVSSWTAWEMNWEVRQGTLSMRLLRPLHPLISYAVSNLAALPMRFALTLPVIAAFFFAGVSSALPHDFKMWALIVLSLPLGWAVTFFVNAAIGSLSMLMDSSVKIMDVWLAAFFVFSGYLFPLDLFPPWLRTAAEWLPFRYQIGVPVELMTRTLTLEEGAALLLRQALWAGGMGVLALGLWRFSVKRYQAYGG